MTADDGAETASAPRPSMFEFAGGEPAFLRLAAAHHERCLQDPVLNHPFSHPGHPEHVERLAAYLAETFGGPPSYSRSCGGYAGMLGIHAGMGAEADLGARFVECFVHAADDAGLPDDPEFRRGLRAYMEWATQVVPAVSPREAAARRGAPVPRWSWTGLERDAPTRQSPESANP
jgi:hemoglobin